MTRATLPPAAVADLPLAPKNPLPRRQQLQAVRTYHTGAEVLRDAGGPVTRLKLAPHWLVPEVVLATSPQGAHDVLGQAASDTDRAPTHDEVRQLFGESLFTMRNRVWLSRRRILQPVFTRKSVSAFGGHMAQAAAAVADDWADGQVVDLDAAGRRVTMRALGRAVLGIDLDQRADLISGPMRIALNYVRARAASPVKAPHWLPTPDRHRARTAAGQLRALAGEILQTCHDHRDHDTPLVRLMMAAHDPETGRTLTDHEICDELVVFMLAGYDTTATTLSYALWTLGHHRDMQDRVRAEAAAIGDRELAPADLVGLTYTVQVLHRPGAIQGP